MFLQARYCFEGYQQKAPRKIGRLDIDQSKACDFFDEGREGNPGPNGIGGIAFLSSSRIFSFKERIGVGSNKTTKFDAIKLPLKLALNKNVGDL